MLPTTLNIQFKLKGQSHISILPGQNLKPDDLTINYSGILQKKEMPKEDDDDEIQQFLDDQGKKDYKDRKIGRPIVFDKDSFFNFKLLAPKAEVKIGETATLRGQILAKKIKIGKNSILSREEVFEKESEPAKVVEDQGIELIVNEIIVIFTNETAPSDVQDVARLVGGRITGSIEKPPIYKIEVDTNTTGELMNFINQIKNTNNPLIINVIPNIIGEPIL